MLRLLVWYVSVPKKLLISTLADLPVNIGRGPLDKGEAERTHTAVSASLTGVVVDRGLIVHSVLVKLLLQLGGFGTQLLHRAVDRQIDYDQVIKLLN